MATRKVTGESDREINGKVTEDIAVDKLIPYNVPMDYVRLLGLAFQTVGLW